MANSPTDAIPAMMQEDFGTKYLITDPKADRYLFSSEAKQKKFTEFCGGAGGWDDFCERMGE